MIARLARRLGFAQSVPVSIVDDWLMPRRDEAIPLAPRGGAAAALVDGVGRIQPAGATYTLEWTLAAGARWVSAIESERVTQRLVAPAVLETTVETPAGPVVQRTAAAVVDGEPVLILEIENRGGVAIAVGLVARPLVHGGRGFLPRAVVDAAGLDLGEQGAVRLEGIAASAVADGSDLLTALPAADSGARERSVSSRSGGAQAAAVVPLPHTATMRAVVELGARVRPTAAVPSIDDVQRGWRRHLDAGVAIAVEGTDIGERLDVASRTLLTDWPSPAAEVAAITALSELGFGNDAGRLLADPDRLEACPELLAAIARWCQLGDPGARLDQLDALIGPIGRSAHATAAAPAVSGPGWMGDAFASLADRLEMIEQPDVANRIRSFDPRPVPSGSEDRFEVPSGALLELASPMAAARLAVRARAALLADRAQAVDLLPGIPAPWRGRSIDALRMPIAGGTISFGVRWHGPRPALLWEIDSTAPAVVTASAIDPEFTSSESSGEALLADPGWPRT